MAGFNRFRGGGLGNLYPGMNNLPQSNVNRMDDDRRNTRGGAMTGFDRRDERDFARLATREPDPTPRRRRYSPDPQYSSMRGNRRDDQRIDYSTMDHVGDTFSSRGQRNNESDFNRAGRSMGPPNRGDGILGAKPGDMPSDLASSSTTGALGSQLAQQQQQLMAMVQTQSLLAAIQAQASAAAKRGGGGGQPPSLLQGMRMNDHGRTDNTNYRQNQNQYRKRRMSPNRGPMRNRNQQGPRQQQRSQNQRSGWQNRDRDRLNQNQRRDRDRGTRMSESSKKSEEPTEEPYIEEVPEEEEEKEKEEEAIKEKEETKETEETEEPKNEEPKEKKDEDKKEQPSEAEDSKAKSQSDELSVNLAGQNVDQLCRSLFDNYRHKYVCKVCKIMCTKEMSFRQHLFGRRHVKTWLESQGRSFEAEIFRKATEEATKTTPAKEEPKPDKEETAAETPKEQQETPEVTTEETSESKDEQQPPEETAVAEVEEEPAAQDTKEPTPLTSDSAEAMPAPEPVKEEKKETKEKKEKEKKELKELKLDIKYSCETRKTAVKDGDYITISSVNEARVRINGFDSGINTEGCEFVKAVSGFQCRLCKTFIAMGYDVIKHVKGRKHQSNYRVYIHEHSKYEANQKIRNKELAKMLSEREGDPFLLYEVSDEEEETRRPSRYRSENPIKITKYVVANEEEDCNASMEDTKADDEPADNVEPEPSQEDSHDQDKTMDDDGGVEDGGADDHGVDDGGVDDGGVDDGGADDGGADDGGMDDGDVGGDGDVDDGGDDTNVVEKEETSLDDVVDLDAEDDSQESLEDKNVNDGADISLDADVSQDLLEEEEPLAKKAKPTPPAKRGRKTARGAAQGGRGRGRGRGGKRNTRQSPRAAPKPMPSSDDNELINEGVDFMDGFEVIDEVADDEM